MELKAYTHLHGEYPELDTEINTTLPYVSVGGFFASGKVAHEILNEINDIWLTYNISVREAVKIWCELLNI